MSFDSRRHRDCRHGHGNHKKSSPCCHWNHASSSVVFLLLMALGCFESTTTAFVVPSLPTHHQHARNLPTTLRRRRHQCLHQTTPSPNGDNTNNGNPQQTFVNDTTSSVVDFETVMEFPNRLSRMASSVMRTIRWGNTVTPAASASLYMNPATQRLATNLTVSWEPHVADMIQALQRLKTSSLSSTDKTSTDDTKTSTPLIIGVVGIPGSGKSTSVSILASCLGDNTVVMPMDGYHYSLEELAKMPDPADVIYRRGAPDTFDPASLVRDLQRIKFGQEPTVSVPGFDHAIGDPQPHQHLFQRKDHDIVIVEGIYLMHQADGWEHVKPLLDFCIYIDADIDVCIDRLKIRNQCIPGYTPEEIEVRCEAVDRVNAETVLKSSQWASLTVQSSAMASATKTSSAAAVPDECETDILDEIATEEEIEQYVETVKEEAEAIIQEL